MTVFLRPWSKFCARAAMILVLAISSRHAAGDEKPAAVPEVLKGKWLLVSTEEGGKRKNYGDRSILFVGNKYHWYYKDLLVKRATVTINTKLEPHTMDLYHEFGPAAGKVAMCIFKVEKDTLTIADGVFDGGRPSAFDSGKPPCSSVTVWKRQK